MRIRIIVARSGLKIILQCEEELQAPASCYRELLKKIVKAHSFSCCLFYYWVRAAKALSCKSGPSILHTLPLHLTTVNRNIGLLLPDKADAADSVPVKSNLKDSQENAKADVFFVYPTIFSEIHKRPISMER